MKVIRIDDEETKLTKRQKQKIAILKLTENGKYIENIGIKDNEFFLLTEGDDDEQYLAFMFLDKNPSLVDDVKLLRLRAKAREIDSVLDALKGYIKCQKRK
jgi:hypothetical protein